MGLSAFNWSVLHSNGTVVKVFSTHIETALEVAYLQTGDEQPLAVIRGDYGWKDNDALEGEE